MNCYACGQSVSAGIPFPNVSTPDDVSSFLRTAAYLSDLISSLTVTRTRLLQRLNEHRASTSVFPPEILSTIFQHASPPPNFDPFDFSADDTKGDMPESHSLITLGAVSWHWRQVILATPQLWANMSILINRQNAERKAKLIQLYLKNVGNMSLSLHISRGPRDCSARSELDPAFESIRRGAQKLKLLSIRYIPKDWILRPDVRFTQLEDLRLKWSANDISRPGPSDPQMHSFPQLHQLRLSSTSIYVPPHPLCQSLAVLRFIDVSLDISIKMLLLCPNLVEYMCHQSQREFDTNIPELSEPMTFSHMKIFYTPLSTTALFSSVLHNLNFPVLEALGLELGADADGLEDLISFISRLPTTWPIVEISGHGYSYAVLRRIFECLPPHVRSLHLPHIDSRYLRYTLRSLEGSDHSSPYIVGLHKICIDSSRRRYQPVENSDAPSIPQMFLNMVSTRKDRLIDGQFCLEIKSDEICWGDVQGQLEQMAADGFRLKIAIL